MESPAIGAPAWAAGAMGCRGPPWRESWGIKEIPTFAKQKSYVTLGLVGGWATPLKNMSSSVGSMTFPIVWKVIKAMFQTTNQKHFAPRKSGEEDVQQEKMEMWGKQRYGNICYTKLSYGNLYGLFIGDLLVNFQNFGSTVQHSLIISWSTVDVVYPLVKCYITNWKITMLLYAING